MNTYQAVVGLPTTLTTVEEVREYAIKRARSMGYIVEDDTICDVSHHTRSDDGWEFLVATIEARIPRAAEAHPVGKGGEWIPRAISASGARRRGSRAGAL